DFVSSAGSVIDHVVYDSFGKVLSETSASNGDRFKFAGMEYDPTSSKNYDHARWYSSVTGRFTTSDPLRFSAGDSNLYRYTANNAVNCTDPTGEVVWFIPIITGAAGALGGALVAYWTGGRIWAGAIAGGATGVAMGFNPGFGASLLIGGAGGALSST